MSDSILKLHPDAVQVNIKPGARVVCYRQHPERMQWWRWEYKGHPSYQCTGCGAPGCCSSSKSEDDRFERVEQMRLL